MKNLLLYFFLFCFSNIIGQKSIQFALVDLDTIENYLINQIRTGDQWEKLIKKEGQMLVVRFSKDILFVQKRSMGCFMNAEQMYEYENYLLDLQLKIQELEKSMNLILEKRQSRNDKNIKPFLKKEFYQFGVIYQYQLVPQEGVLFQKEENPTVALDLISFIQNSKEFPNWLEEQFISEDDISSFYTQLFLIKYYFKNYKYKWVRERWK